MKVEITVRTKSQAEAVKAAMNDKLTRTLVIVMGTLLQLPTDQARRRVLRFVRDELEEQAASELLETTNAD